VNTVHPVETASRKRVKTEDGSLGSDSIKTERL
jgi:hypothetical protein